MAKSSIKTFIQLQIMSTKNLISTFCITLLPFYMIAQHSKFSIALQTTTIEKPTPFGGFKVYETMNGHRNHYSIEILGRYFLNKNLALRLRTGLTKYQFKSVENFFADTNLKGQLEKYAIGIESRRILGENAAFRFGCEAQISFFKKMLNGHSGDFTAFTNQYDTNSLLSLNPLMGADWFIWRGLSLSTELRLPFERIRYNNKGVFLNNGDTFNEGSYNSVGFGKPICSFQIGYQF